MPDFKLHHYQIRFQKILSDRLHAFGCKVFAFVMMAALLAIFSGLLSFTHADRALAFDPQKVFEQELKKEDPKPDFADLFRNYFKKKKLGKKNEALAVLKYAAEHGNLRAQWKLGKMYSRGKDVNKNHAEAFGYYKQLVDRYSEVRPKTSEWAITGKAMVALGRYYVTGIPDAGISANRDEAQVMFTTAAMYFGDSDGQFELARMILADKNEGTERRRQALRLLNSARRKGHVGALALMGNALVEGEFVEKNQVRGLAMLTKALSSSNKRERKWIEPLQAQAFALSNEGERREAIAQINGRSSKGGNTKKSIWDYFKLKETAFVSDNVADNAIGNGADSIGDPVASSPLILPSFAAEQ